MSAGLDGGSGATPRAAVETIRFPVEGMTCSSCVNRITRALRRLDGVVGVRVDLGRETVTVRRANDRVPDAAIAATIADAGYGARLDAAEVLPATSRRPLFARLRGRST